jgi:hypothetical protein
MIRQKNDIFYILKSVLLFALFIKIFIYTKMIIIIKKNNIRKAKVTQMDINFLQPTYKINMYFSACENIFLKD